MSEMQGAHILVVDDDTRIRTLLQRYLSEHGYRVTTAGTAAEAREKLSGLKFDVGILDVMMPGESGLSLAKDLRTERNMALIILSARGAAEDRIAGLEHGVDDYLPKPFEPRELVLRIESLLRRTHVPDPVEIKLGACTYSFNHQELTCNGKRVNLSRQELAILHALAHKPNSGISRADLAAAANDISERAVDVYVNRLRRKIEPEPASPLYLLTVRGIGYALHS